MNGSLKNNLESARFIKDFAHEEKIDLSGRIDKPLEGVLSRVDAIVDKMKLENQQWLEEKTQAHGMRDYLASIGQEDIEAAYKQGLRRCVVQYYRLYKRQSAEELDKFSEENFIRELVSAYTYDFILLLRASKNHQATPIKGLEIAKEAYHHNPSVLKNLTEKYPDFSIHTITYAAAHYPTKSESFLDNLRKVLPELREQFPDIPESIIAHHALAHPQQEKAEQALRNIESRATSLQTVHAGFSRQLIMHVLNTYAKNPESFFKKAAKQKVKRIIPNISINDLVRLENFIANPKYSFTLKTAKKGGLYVALEQERK